MVFNIGVDFYDEYDEKEVKEVGFYFGENFDEVFHNIINYYGEDEILHLSITPFSPDNGLMFDCNKEEDMKIYASTKLNLEDKVIW